MVEPITRDFRVRRGDNWAGETFRLISDQGAAFWTSATVRSQIRTSVDSATVAFEFSFTPTVTSEGSNGVLTFVLTMSKTQTAALTPGAYVGDIEVEAAGLPKTTFCVFSMKVLHDVTR